MMTLEELRKSQINPDVAREAYEQASQRLGDVIAIKDAFEQKASGLFSSYVTVAIALFSAGGLTGHASTFGVAGAFYVAGAGLFAWALRDAAYGVRASDPELWLTKGVIDGNERALPSMLAYIAFHHQKRITTSQHANGRKATLIRLGVMLGLLGPVALLLAFAA